MDVFAVVEPLITKLKPKLIAVAGTADRAVTDDGLRSMAGIIHAAIGFPGNRVIKQEMVAAVLIKNRLKVRAALYGIPVDRTKLRMLGGGSPQFGRTMLGGAGIAMGPRKVL